MEPGYNTMTALQHAEALVSKLQNNSELYSASELKTLEDILHPAIFSIRRMINSLKPVNRVPPEVFSIILSLVSPCLPNPPVRYKSRRAPFYWPSSLTQSRQDIVRSTHVCHYWRKTVLAIPILWVSMDSGDVRQSATLIPAFVERSRPAHLQLFVDITKVGKDLQSVFDEEPSRIGELHLFGYGNMYTSEQPRNLIETCRLPQLEYLTLMSKMGISNSPPVPTRMLFNNELPRLRTLTLLNLPWFPSNRFDNLTHLCITKQREYPDLEIADLFSLLRPCHRLEELVLSGFAHKNETRRELYWRPLKFHRLRRLAVGYMSATLLAWFITHILNPAGLTIRVFDMRCGVSDDFTLGGAASIRVPHRVRLTMQRPVLVFTAVDRDASTGIRVEREMCFKKCREEDCPDWAENLWTLWNLHSVEELWLDEYAGLMRLEGYEAFGSKLLGELAAVTTLVLSQSAPKADPKIFGDWLACLTTPRDDEGDGEGDGDSDDGAFGVGAYCPKLATLHLWVEVRSMPCAVLADFCTARARMGCPLKRLLVEFPTPDAAPFSDADRIRLEECVASVEFRVACRPPKMVVPARCNVETHDFWPAW
ncbi:hypothetical protein B0H21DRAFT_738079 [Amylocystis lapponica]|nr:hypothetical protein B0H21DRAFT_738079 [Amylocystis lapponica]